MPFSCLVVENIHNVLRYHQVFAEPQSHVCVSVNLIDPNQDRRFVINYFFFLLDFRWFHFKREVFHNRLWHNLQAKGVGFLQERGIIRVGVSHENLELDKA